MKIPIVKSKTIEELDLKKIKIKLAKEKIVLIRGLFSKNDILRKRKKIEKNFSPKNDKVRPKNSYDLIKKNYQRITVGMGGGIVQSRTNSRIMRTLYNPLYCKDIYGMHSIFNKLLTLQNILYGFSEDYGKNSKRTQDNVFVASRINQYPSGGGFLSPHKDSSAAISSKKISGNKNFYQLLLTMSKKGTDYFSGGGIFKKNDKFVQIDNYTNIGDVILYNGKTVHGVMDVDSEKKLDLSKLNGRLTAAVTFFKY